MSDDLLKNHRDSIDSIDATILRLLNERAVHAHEIGVLKGIATTYVITVRDAQPIYDNQQEVLSILVGALMDSDGRFLSPAFTADWHDLGDGPGTEAARLRLVVDQIASLTDLSAVSLHDRIRGTHWRVGDKPLW